MLRNDVRRFYGDNGEDDDVENPYHSRTHHDPHWNKHNLKEIEQLSLKSNKNYKFNVNAQSLHFCVNYKSDWAKGGNPCSRQGFH